MESVLNFIYPPVCQLCGAERATATEGFVGGGCWSGVRFIKEPCCARCGLPYPAHITHEFRCENCADLELSFSYARSAVAANSLILDVIHKYKYNRALWFEPFLSDLLVRQAQPVLAKEKWELEEYPKEELAELQAMYEKKGLSRKTAKLVADELTAKDAFAAHIDVELNIDPDDLSNPWQAAVASALSFFIGAVIPLLTIVLTPSHARVYVTFIAVLVALTLTGYLSASFSKTNQFRATVRVIIGGAMAMIVTYVIGHLFGNKVL